VVGNISERRRPISVAELSSRGKGRSSRRINGLEREALKDTPVTRFRGMELPEEERAGASRCLRNIPRPRVTMPGHLSYGVESPPLSSRSLIPTHSSSSFFPSPLRRFLRTFHCALECAMVAPAVPEYVFVFPSLSVLLEAAVRLHRSAIAIQRLNSGLLTGSSRRRTYLLPLMRAQNHYRI
jgi:hypothetical protein